MKLYDPSTQPFDEPFRHVADTRNPHYPPDRDWDHCRHEWEAVDCMSDRAVRCVKCGAPGECEADGSVYWPTT